METFADRKMKALVIQTAFPGDAILTLQMIQELKKQNQNIIIDVLCIPSTKEIFQSSPSVDDVLIIDKKGKHKNFFSFISFVKEVKAKGYDKIYSPHRSFRSAFIVWILGVSDSYGFSNSSFPYTFKNIINYNPADHEAARNLSLIGFDTSGDNWKILPEISISESSKEKVNIFLKLNKLENFVSVAPGSVWNTKQYPSEYFNKINNFFTGKGYKVLLIGGYDDKKLCESFADDANINNAAGGFSLVESVELLKTAKLLICNDSAPTHLGMCADIPVLTIYCSTVPEFGFYPYNAKSSYLTYNDLSCKPCGIHGHTECPVGTFDCGKMLKPEVVIESAIKLLENNER
jgi:heptosyltransferase-2